jgi:hypothetical protein
MATNVRRGFRAGGRAPVGYRLEHVDTGAVREGRPVLKSRLVLEPETAPLVQAYLKARAAGQRRTLAAEQSGLVRYKSSLVGIEWNALTYAGSTVWNVNQPRGQGTSKRRARGEWHLKAGTHEALISEDEAERILARLDAYTAKQRRSTAADYLLTGLLKTAGGATWRGDHGKYYRTGSRSVPLRDVDATVLDKLREDLRSHDFASRVVAQIRASAGREHAVEAAQLTRDASTIDGRISRFLEMAAKLETPAPVLRKIDELERERIRLHKEARTLTQEAQATRAAKAMTEDQVLAQLDLMAEDIGHYDRERLKDLLNKLLSGITLNPGEETLQLHYKIAMGRSSKPAHQANALSWRPHEDANLMRPAELTTYTKLKKAA